MSPQDEWDPVLSAAHDLVQDYHAPDGGRGAAALARRLGLNPRVLANEANPDNDHHKLGLQMAVLLSVAAEDPRVLRAFAAAMHHAVFPLPDFSRVSDVELLNAYTLWQSFLGRTNQTIHAAMEDSRITRAEYEQIRARFMDHIGKGFELLNRIEALIDD